MTKPISKSTQTARKIVRISGINVLSTSLTSVLTGVKSIVSYNQKITENSQKSIIFTLNPELVLMAQTNLLLKKALLSAQFPVADGIGLAQAAAFLSMPKVKNRIFRPLIYLVQGLFVGLSTVTGAKRLTESLNVIKGRKLFLEIVSLAKKNNWKIFFLGGRRNEAALAAQKLKIKKSKIQTLKGPFLDESGNPATKVDIKLQKDAIDIINKFAPQILFVAFNNPKQEIWVHKNFKKLNTRILMAVGGTFRYISGLSKLPPVWVNSFGFEWAWRLATEPYRIRRIINATIVFPYKVFLFKIRH